jgi:catechol 2,3-dioxygenase-like lactoylglutathione lyase family enzyme
MAERTEARDEPAAAPIERAFFNVLTRDLDAARRFYVDLLGFRLAFESDWFVQVAAPGQPLLELGLLRQDGDVVPEPGRSGGGPAGMLSLVVPDVDAVFVRAKEAGAPVLEPPRNLFYGQRRMVLQDPDGTLVDVSTACPPDPSWLARVSQREGDGAYVETPE